jgi:TldD protein
VGDGGGTLADAPAAPTAGFIPMPTRWPMPPLPPRSTLREIDAYARAADPRVVQVTASLGASLQEVEILRPDGMRLATSGRWRG